MDFFQRHPNPDGKRIMDEFSKAPYGWMKDTTRYLLAALFYAQKIKLRTNGNDELTVVGDQSLDAFKNNSSFTKVTINPNLDNETPPEVRQAAARRLGELTDESVIALAQRIAEVASKYLPKLSSRSAEPAGNGQCPSESTPSVSSRLERSLTGALMGDGAEATTLFGAPDSEIYHDLIWARSLKKSLDGGAKEILQELADLNQLINNLEQQSLLPGLQDEWQQQTADVFARIKDGSFVDDLPAVAQKLDELKFTIATHCQTYVDEQKAQIEAQVDSLLASTEFKSLDESSQATFSVAANEAVPFIDASLAAVQSAPNAVVRAFNKIQQVRSSDSSCRQPSPDSCNSR